MHASRISCVLVSLALMLAAGPYARATDPELTPDDQEKRVNDLINQALREGPDLYNGTFRKPASPLACTYYFKGVVESMLSFLDHKPELQKSIRVARDKAMNKQNVNDQAFALFDLLHYVRKELDPDAIPPLPQRGTLWERLGGEKNVKRIVDRFVDAAIKDPKVNFSRNGKYPLDAKQVADIKRKIVQLTSVAAGGPEKVYLHMTMKEAHKGMGITESEFEAMTRHLSLAMIASGVRKDDIEKIMGAVAVAKGQIVQPQIAAAQANPVPIRTLWERMGGEENITKIADHFIDASMKDPKVNFSRNGKYQLNAHQVAKLKRHIVTLASAVGGGPLQYEGKTMKEVHAGMGITETQFEALLAHLKTALLRYDVPPADVELVITGVRTTRADIVP